jgi:hypothetical protein
MKRNYITFIILLFASMLSQAQSWNEIAKSLPSYQQNKQYYGSSVDIDGDYAVIGANGSEMA